MFIHFTTLLHEDKRYLNFLMENLHLPGRVMEGCCSAELPVDFFRVKAYIEGAR